MDHVSPQSSTQSEVETSETPAARPALSTFRRAAFVREYLIDLNATKAATRAGFKDANSYGPDLLADPEIAHAIEVAKAQRATRVGMTQDMVLQEMSLLSHSSIDHYVVDDEGNIDLVEGAPEGAMGAISSVNKKIKTVLNPKTGEVTKTYDVTIKLWDKPTPLKIMGKHIGLFPDKMQLTGPNGGPIETVTRVERVIVKRGQDTPD